MTTASIEIPTRASPLQGPWQDLCRRVRAYMPHVVVLIARKMPRLMELFGLLEFGGDCVVLSDMAVPFSHSYIRGRRIAILDDVVNVGSTLTQAQSSVMACGAKEVRLFALGRKSDSTDGLEIECLDDHPLSAARYAALVAAVPEQLRRLNKPYDLEFPVIECRLLPPLRTASHLLEVLRRWDRSVAVHDLTPRPATDSLARLTVDLSGDRPGNYKLRLYLDQSSGACNVVPFAIPDEIGPDAWPNRDESKALLCKLQQALEGMPEGASLWPREPHARAALYAHSLDLGLRSIEEMASWLSLQTTAYSTSDAAMLFGPAALETQSCATRASLSQRATCGEFASGTSMFWSEIANSPKYSVVNRVRELADGGDLRTALVAFFDVLADLVGASDVSQYELHWPFDIKAVKKQPYLRLRIGPTFADLIEISRQLIGSSFSDRPVRTLVSQTLDSLVDCGAVVPTIARYDGRLFRVYRKGETPDRDAAVARLAFAIDALRASHPQISLKATRLAKINAILSYSNRIEALTTPHTEQRGNVGGITGGVLDGGNVDVVQYARNIGRLRLD